jgi:hypothetical protein
MSENLKAIQQVLSKEKRGLLGKANAVAVGIGYKTVQGKRTHDLSIVCSVEKKLGSSSLSTDDLIPASIEDIPVDVIETGKIVAQQDPKSRIRPAPGGVSVGHVAITAGTLGCWVKKNGEFQILSNNHVLANSNSASIGDPILQPGPYDSGVNPGDKIAELTEFIPIQFGGPDNLVDAAIARAVEVENGGSSCGFAGAVASFLNRGARTAGRSTRLKPVKVSAIDDVVRNEILNIGVVNELAEAVLGMEVKKMGRTTELTFGEVTQIDATVKVQYSVQSAFFTDQIITTDMSEGGDSGSAVVTKDGNKLVGLLFAGSDVLTVSNRIQNVFSALGITF